MRLVRLLPFAAVVVGWLLPTTSALASSPIEMGAIETRREKEVPAHL
ncbi:hypothetical protein [Candidatus Methylomirabilis sp.]|uniref:Uncharacterized protein n=1 Tax=Candidatus Methylomirabilis tolerans TaxID=3123416 RepID=A0AAJ1AHF5_9BACT|nr:hypothetical protein [Candidatus Methylomirabilis sp.]